MVDITTKWSANNITSPAYSYTAVTPSDTIDDPNGPFKAIFVGVGGDIVFVGLDNVAVTFKNTISGSILPMIGRRINSTNTTATNLVALR